MAPGDAHWKVGVITVPSSTGSMAITGLGGTPKAVIFYGTNWLTEDSSVTADGSGVFRGMAAPKWDDAGTMEQNAACVVSAPAGNAHNMTNGAAIHILDTSGLNVSLYIAELTSLDADGFTLNWTQAPAGGYKVIYIALMDVVNAGAFVGTTATTLALGWKAGSSLLHGAWAGPHVGGADRAQEFYGGAAYPGTTPVGWFGAGLTAFTFPTSFSGQYNIGIYDLDPTVAVAQGGHFTGPFLITSDIVAHPTGGPLTDFLFSGDSVDAGMLVVWDDEDSETGRLTPGVNEGDTVTVSGLPFEPGLVIGYSISDEPPGQGTGSRGAIGFSVVTPDFEWAVLIDGVGVGAFQSFQRGVVDTVNGGNVHAGTIELTEDGFVVTTENDDIIPSPWVWHAFGHPDTQFQWVPHIYRRILG